MRFYVALIGVLLWPVAAAADATMDRLSRAIHLEEIVDILHQEGLRHGQKIDEQVLAGKGGAVFEAQVKEIYSTEAMKAALRSALATGLNDPQREQASIFYESELGQKIISLENSARRAISDPAIQEMAQSQYEEADRESALYLLVEEYIRANDLVHQNVEGTMAADFNFFRGVVDGRGIPGDEGAMISSLISNEAEMRKDTEAWLFGFLMMAYRPLSESELRENIAFSRTVAGQALNEAFFDGFDEMYVHMYYELGLAVGRAMTASDL